MFRGRSFATIKLCILLLAVVFAGRIARAFSLEGEKWTLNRTVVMHLSLDGPGPLQDGFGSFNESAADALNTWNAYLAHMKFAPVVGSPLPPGDSDSDNSVFFSNTVYGETFGDRVIAISLTSSRNSVFTEGDVIFNNRENWDSYRGPLQTDLDFHRVALHEFGHVLGLDHPDSAGQHVIAIMNSITSSIDVLHSDDIAGAQNLYDSGPPYRSSNPSPNLVNLSTRAFVGTGGNVLIGGFIIQGSQPATVVLRAIGHSLAARGVSNPLSDPLMEVHNAAGTLVAQNDDWFTGEDAETIASYGLDPSNSRESSGSASGSPRQRSCSASSRGRIRAWYSRRYGSRSSKMPPDLVVRHRVDDVEGGPRQLAGRAREHEPAAVDPGLGEVVEEDGLVGEDVGRIAPEVVLLEQVVVEEARRARRSGTTKVGARISM